MPEGISKPTKSVHYRIDDGFTSSGGGVYDQWIVLLANGCGEVINGPTVIESDVVDESEGTVLAQIVCGEEGSLCVGTCELRINVNGERAGEIVNTFTNPCNGKTLIKVVKDTSDPENSNSNVRVDFWGLEISSP